jgi:acyl-ACP thioesterase
MNDEWVLNEPLPSWTERFRVRSYEMDGLGAARASTITNYLQEAAANHAAALGWAITDAAEDQRQNWMLVRLQLRLHRWPRWRDEIEVETWPSAIEGLIAHREFSVRSAGGEEIGAATSAWMMVDLERRRATRLPRALHGFPFLDRPRPIESPFPKIVVPEDVETVERFSVRRADLDINGHANQASYVEWACETVPEEVWRTARPTELAVAFRSEVRGGDVVESRRIGTADGAHVHQLRSALTGRELASLRTVWTVR